MKDTTRRADCPGYLELIIPETGGENPQARAYITDVYGTLRRPWYVGFFGSVSFEGPTVAEVKAPLFAALDAHFSPTQE